MSGTAPMSSVTITFPERWAIVMPCGCVDGLMRGSVRMDTAEAVWKKFTPLKRDRDKEARAGWTIRPATADDIANQLTATGPHEEVHA